MTTATRIEGAQRLQRNVIKDFKKNFPGISDENARTAAEKWIGLTIVHLDADPAAFAAAFNQHMQQEAENGADWAKALQAAAYEGKIKPAYAKAVAVGADPVPLLQVEAGLSKEQAEEFVAKLKATEEADAEANGADDIEPVDYGSENPDNDARAY